MALLSKPNLMVNARIVTLPHILGTPDLGVHRLGLRHGPGESGKLNRGESYIRLIPGECLAGLIQLPEGKSQFSGAHHLARRGGTDVLISGPTPFTAKLKL